MDGNLNLYYIFYVVGGCGNISAAAKELYISQPAISKAISKLEQSLNATLFIRSSRGVILTEEGRCLYEQAENAFLCLQNGEKRIRQMTQLGVGHITIGVSSALCRFILLPHLKQYIQKHPHLKIKISCHTSSETVKALEQGKIDVGLMGLPEKLRNLSCAPLAYIHDTFVCTRQYLDNLRIREGADVTQVLGHAVFMMLGSDNYSRKYVEDYLKRNRLEITDILEVSNMDLLIEFAKTDLGIACVIREFVQEELREGSLEECSFASPIPKRQAGFVYAPSVVRGNPIVSGFMEHFRQIFAMKAPPRSHE